MTDPAGALARGGARRPAVPRRRLRRRGRRSRARPDPQVGRAVPARRRARPASAAPRRASAQHTTAVQAEAGAPAPRSRRRAARPAARAGSPPRSTASPCSTSGSRSRGRSARSCSPTSAPTSSRSTRSTTSTGTANHIAMCCNRGKRSIAINLKDPRAMEMLRELVARADVVQHNMRYDAAERLGVDYESLRDAEPAPHLLPHARVRDGAARGAAGQRPDRRLPRRRRSARTAGMATRREAALELHARSATPGNGFLSAIAIVQALDAPRPHRRGPVRRHLDRERAAAEQLDRVARPDGSALSSARTLDAHADRLLARCTASTRCADGWLCVVAHCEDAHAQAALSRRALGVASGADDDARSPRSRRAFRTSSADATGSPRSTPPACRVEVCDAGVRAAPPRRRRRSRSAGSRLVPAPVRRPAGPDRPRSRPLGDAGPRPGPAARGRASTRASMLPSSATRRRAGGRGRSRHEVGRAEWPSARRDVPRRGPIRSRRRDTAFFWAGAARGELVGQRLRGLRRSAHRRGRCARAATRCECDASAALGRAARATAGSSRAIPRRSASPSRRSWRWSSSTRASAWCRTSSEVEPGEVRARHAPCEVSFAPDGAAGRQCPCSARASARMRGSARAVARPRDRGHRADRVLEGLRPQRAPARGRGGEGRAATTRASTPADIDGLVTFTLDPSDEIGLIRCLGIRDLAFTDAHPRRRRGVGRDDASGARRGRRRARPRSWCAGARSTSAPRTASASRRRAACSPPAAAPARCSGACRSARRRPASVGRARGASATWTTSASPTRLRPALGRAARATRRRTRPRGSTSKPITLEDHQALALDRRAGAAPARLLPGERRRRRAAWSRALERARDLRQPPVRDRRRARSRSRPTSR